MWRTAIKSPLDFNQLGLGFFLQGLGFCGDHCACALGVNDTQHFTDDGLVRIPGKTLHAARKQKNKNKNENKNKNKKNKKAKKQEKQEQEQEEQEQERKKKTKKE